MDASSSTQIVGGVLEVRTHARKGRSLYTTRHVKGGEIVLNEEPLLLLAAPEMARSSCAACLRAVGPPDCITCHGCRQACFCSPSCQQTAQATPWLHPGPICSAYARLVALGLSAEDQGQLRFLLHALALRHAETPEAERRFAALSGLVGEATEAERAVAARLAPALVEALKGVGVGAGPLPGLEVEALATLLRKEQLNSYGVLASPQQAAAAMRAAAAVAPAAAAPQQQPVDGREAGGSGSGQATMSAAPGGGNGGEEVEDGERRLRGSALYAQASLINHECLPNVARFDFWDSGRPDATHVAFRALHDLPAGTELAQSYVPLHWSLGERQAQCREVYGFDCTCPRCQTESQWSDDDDDEGGESEWETDSGDGTDMEDDAAAADGTAEAEAGGDEEVEMQDAQPVIVAPPGEEGPLEPNYLRLFLLKYMCAAPGCFGTSAPPKPGSKLLECNVCGRARSEREFLRELEKSQQQSQQRQQQKQEQQQQGVARRPGSSARR